MCFVWILVFYFSSARIRVERCRFLSFFGFRLFICRRGNEGVFREDFVILVGDISFIRFDFGGRNFFF